MKKEKITLDAIKKDLMKIVNEQISIKSEWRFCFIAPITLCAILLGVFLKNIVVGLLIFSAAAYHIVRYVMEFKEYRAAKNAVLTLLERGEVSISTEIISHIAREVVCEPRRVGRREKFPFRRRQRASIGNTITVYYFESGSSWRLPAVDRHYSWSDEFYVSSKGLENISLAGDSFFFVRLQNYPHIAYIYPCKTFEIDASLKE